MASGGSKRRKLAHDSSDNESQQPVATKKVQKSFFKNASNWDLEQDYESRPRKGKKAKKDSNRLPIRTADGRLEQTEAIEEDTASIESDTEWLEGREDEVEWEPEADKEKEEAPEIPEPQRIREAQEELAKIAMAMNENPEEHVGGFKALAKIGQSNIIAIQMLALMTQMTVYKDVIPGYRIRPQEENGPKEQLSKDVRTLRQYEQALVSGYQAYIKELARCSKMQVKAARGGQSLSTIAITCVCTLVTSVPHFNFRSDLLKILVGKLSRRKINADGVKCLQALETLLRDDEEGRPSLETVSFLSKMLRAREFQVDERVINVFLSLRLLSEFSGKASTDNVEGMAQVKKKREFRTKRERKAKKEQKALDKDMSQADALVSHDELERMQSETLKLVFATYFRILKLRMSHLMGAVLEGLAKYSHLINQDFFGDLLEALKDLIRHSDNDADEEPTADEEGKEDEEDDDDVLARNLTREALLCTVTAFALLAGQDAHNSRNDLHLDLSFFTTHLFKSILSLSTNPDLELTRPSNISDSTASKVNVQTTTVLLLRSLTGILLPPWNIRSVPPLRLAAFVKQLMTAALQLPDKSTQAVLVLLSDIAHTHSKKVCSLWNTEERKGDGRYNPTSDSIEASNPFTATVWEGELLRKHYSPKVREGVKLLEKGMSG
ncbi:nucleolar complex-associated protein-domain-containing protein [Dactylonectria macrodidyma]|uniref:Nucleolar complex-associated protein 3 n=1 Tax=Dactylonectria macrodidyma TaxID=307937 RepID=A0A9P9ETB0_9HYPO|nr:nucleolar complex-associated protein-domain-containing protein [Dactylonectria macrodidyma]